MVGTTEKALCLWLGLQRRPSASGWDYREGLVPLVGTKEKAKCLWLGLKSRPSASVVGTTEKA